MENFNACVDKLIEASLLRRVLAQIDITFSNSVIEAFWRVMKSRWLFLNTLDSVAAVRRCVTHYVVAHNSQIPHSAFAGQTPDEMYFGQGTGVPDELELARTGARQARLAANRTVSCEVRVSDRAAA